MSHAESVMVVALAIYGLWFLLKDIWDMMIKQRFVAVPSASIIVVVRDMEHSVEALLRCILRSVEDCDSICDIIIVDCGAGDSNTTGQIIQRLSDDFPRLKALSIVNAVRNVGYALPLCEGKAILVLDVVNRMSTAECAIALEAFLQGGRS